jgi:hypothetical protein
MKRVSMGILAAALLATGAVACSQNGFQSIAMTKDPSVVSSCEKVADVKARPGAFDDSDVERQLQREASSHGANTILLASDNPNKGTAYKCSMPALTASGKSSGNTSAH